MLRMSNDYILIRATTVIDIPRTKPTFSRRTIEVVSWDVDGTFYSTRKMKFHLLTQAVLQVLQTRSLQAIRELRALHRSSLAVEALRWRKGGCLEELPGDRWTLETGRLQRDWLGPAVTATGTRKGVRELLAFLQRLGIVQVAVSDYRADYKLAALGLRNFFESTYCGQELGRVKPHPALFQAILRDFQILPESLLHIGDRAETDGAAAEAAKCSSLILGRDFPSFPSLLSREIQALPGSD